MPRHMPVHELLGAGQCLSSRFQRRARPSGQCCWTRFTFLRACRLRKIHFMDMRPRWPAQAFVQLQPCLFLAAAISFVGLVASGHKSPCATQQTVAGASSILCSHLGQVLHRCPGLEKCVNHCRVCIACQFFTVWCKEQHVTA